jgi:hypothetical protein
MITSRVTPIAELPRRSRVDPTPGAFTVEQFRCLSWVRATHVAQAYVQEHDPSADLDAAKHLAFGLWLKATGRLDGEFTLARDGEPWNRVYPHAPVWKAPWAQCGR